MQEQDGEQSQPWNSDGTVRTKVTYEGTKKEGLVCGLTRSPTPFPRSALLLITLYSLLDSSATLLTW